MNGIIVLVFFSFFIGITYSLSEAQVKSTTKLMRNTCQPKTKVTDEQIDAMHNGIWGFEKPAMCYCHCFLKMMKALTPDNQIDVESVKKQLATMPQARIAPSVASFEKCAPYVESLGLSDKCEISYNLAKCFYESNPANYFFP